MRFKVTLAYDGSGFAGWQRQERERSVQGTLEKTISKIHKAPIVVHGSGRTDAGVHALGQTCHFDASVNMDAAAWLRALRSWTPKDIAILDVEAVDDCFHARFNVTAKTYRYVINTGPFDVFGRHYIYQYNRALDLEAMQAAVRCFLGTHDFTSFNSTPSNETPNQVRTVNRFDVVCDGDGKITFTIHGDGFLRYMVRRIVATCVAVGAGRMTLQQIEHALCLPDKRLVHYNIDACGLYLVSVDY